MDAQTRERRPSAEQPQRTKEAPRTNPDRSRDVKEQSGEPAPPLRPRLRQHWLLATVGAIVLIAALVGGLLCWLEVRHYESTDDAFVASRSFSVASKVGGYVTDIPVTDNQHVNAGDLLAKLDERDYRIAIDQTNAQVAAAKANIANVGAQIDSQQEQIKQAQAQLEQAQAQLQFSQEEFARAQDLAEKGAGTVQRQQQTRSDLQAQQANTERAKTAVTAAQLSIKSLQAQLEGAKAQLGQSQAQLDQAKLNLQYTSVVAAQSGRVVKLSGAKGTFVTAGQSLMMFVPDQVWIVANYKETQLNDMRPGQPVEIRIDAYPGRKLTGHVDSVQPGSGTAFSLLPAENATGNYVKVVQRVPVKIVVDNWPPDLPVGPGMSVVPWTRVR
ncbi:HlyD family secretion protein [Bradyrhizobium sp. 180]|uniref:HlyD family secretion protein n=1 Tax=unclassified Bradyrhizobium TaxID=2631580 RepID=UPI001FFA04D9|nr:HlyD family secretion protein [Bradyrhizobium sp. CW12]MCK1493199.1 HlyD family secretion protein [Bradyrhizobium sp. 180]MCK1527359.1 HlyD family secretion protein [Bradyrhizobium sp. 182]MCK1599025.1 HlyD family secretion protein [Bradyrhizobium sp. 164]MCK1615488.1 HlyD family secretion protein [Bradyrhizobium sp. 159]MCK1648263.1 HlyD family secretion protein [Bradyrhizobium sp. 154]MCK1666044.1 HlyD family secretion protein [Bradyrhizobium sp. 153]